MQRGELSPEEVDPLGEAVALAGLEPTPENCRPWLEQAREQLLREAMAGGSTLKELEWAVGELRESRPRPPATGRPATSPTP